MAINEQIVTGRAHRVLIDKATKLWQRISYWTKGSDVEFNDAKTAETKVGAIDGITDSLASTSSRIAASAKSVKQLNDNLVSDIYVGSDGKLHKMKGGADSVLNFSCPLSYVKNISITTPKKGNVIAFAVLGYSAGAASASCTASDGTAATLVMDTGEPGYNSGTRIMMWFLSNVSAGSVVRINATYGNYKDYAIIYSA